MNLFRSPDYFNPRGMKASRASWGLMLGMSGSSGKSEVANFKTGGGAPMKHTVFPALC